MLIAYNTTQWQAVQVKRSNVKGQVPSGAGRTISYWTAWLVFKSGVTCFAQPTPQDPPFLLAPGFKSIKVPFPARWEAPLCYWIPRWFTVYNRLTYYYAGHNEKRIRNGAQLHLLKAYYNVLLTQIYDPACGLRDQTSSHGAPQRRTTAL